jgi:divalent metal cation (Fe/Co/Zn/Cd) transporter
VLIANAWHHRSDAISSVMALGGIVAARAGMAALDPLAGLLVTATVGLTGFQVREKHNL